jgi:phosphoenolpyruvate carboxykinase (ATP)
MYDQEAYSSFVRELPQALSGPNIRAVDLNWLEPRARAAGIRTQFGSYGWRSAVSSRIAPKTVYLGSESVRLPKISPQQAALIEAAPQELKKVLHLLRTLPFYRISRRMGDNDFYNPACHLYVSAADVVNFRLGYMWGTTLFPPSHRSGPEFTMIHIPEEHPLRQQVLVLPEFNLNIALGTDYMGEDKKGFLRQAMWTADREGMLGLHAGTKIVTARGDDGRLKTYGVFLFGLSATGKSTWSCHQLGLDHKQGEKTLVAQDDICFLRPDGSALGSENNFFVKTDVEEKNQAAMYNALIDKSALLENVMIRSDGAVDFLDESLTANGRAVIQRRKLQIRLKGRMRDIFSRSIDLPPIDELDGLIFAFITRRNTIMSFAQELDPEQAVLAYLWGESTHSYASQPLKAGESVRIVGTDPFIIGSRADKVNRLYEILMTLAENHPGKLRFMQYNTGGIGEIIETVDEGGHTQKRLVREVRRVPIDLMATIQRGDLRDRNSYEIGRLGTRQIVRAEGQDLQEWDIRKYYSAEQIDAYIEDLVDGRRAFTEEIAREGLRSEVLAAADRSFRIDPSGRRSMLSVSVPEEGEAGEPAVKAPQPTAIPKEFKSRPRRSGFGRSR